MMDLDKKFNLPLIREIQKAYPQISVGGSTALYLHGVRLKRFETDQKVDIDLIAPYLEYKIHPFAKITSSIQLIEVAEKQTSGSGNDFNHQFIIKYNDGLPIKIDVRVNANDPEPIVIEHNFLNYKVRSLLEIITAKVRYANKKIPKSIKHDNDIIEMILGK